MKKESNNPPDVAVQPLLDRISAHGPWCGRCGKSMTPANSTAAPELFLCDGCAASYGFEARIPAPKPIELQPKPKTKTALAELAEYCEREALSHDAAFTQVNAGPQWQNYHMTQRDKFRLWATAAREANEQ